MRRIGITYEELQYGIADRSRQFAALSHEIIDTAKDCKILALLIILRRFSGADGRNPFPSREKIAELMGYKSVHRADEAISAAEKRGFLRRVPRFIHVETGEISLEPGAGYRQTSNMYILFDSPTFDVDIYHTGDGPLSPRGGSNIGTPGGSNIGTPGGSNIGTGGGPISAHELDTLYLDTKRTNIPPNPPEGGTRAHTCNLNDVKGNRESKNFVDTRANQRKEANSTQKRKAPERIPEDWQPSASSMKRWRERWPEHQSRIAFELEDFHAYWLNAAGKRAKKSNWDLAATNWLKNSFEGFKSRKPQVEELTFSSLYGEYVPTPEEDLPF